MMTKHTCRLYEEIIKSSIFFVFKRVELEVVSKSAKIIMNHLTSSTEDVFQFFV